MPDGKTHAAITTIAAAGLYGAGTLLGLPDGVPLALAGGCMVGLLITPDLDVNDRIYAHHLLRREAGRLPALAWKTFWLPYSRLVPHRHWLSHAPFIGTSLRLGYLVLLAWLLLALFGHPWPWQELPAWAPWAVWGLVVSDALHWAADLSMTRLKRYRRKSRRLLRFL
jgi:uncharacterized metal-binding protein